MRTIRTARRAAAVLLAGAALFAAGAGTAAADDATPSPGASGTGATEETVQPGTGFRTAGNLRPGVRTTPASASTGDYLYWVFPAAAGEVPTVSATVTLPEAASRHGNQTWQLDVYDGLRRRQACASGKPTRTASAQDTQLELSCRLRTVRAWSEAWADDPLPGAYYIRLTVLRLPDQDLGLPVQAQIGTTSTDAGGSKAVDGELAAPLTPVAKAGATLDPDAVPSVSATEESDEAADDEADPSASPVPAGLAQPEDGWGGGWWSDRWIWTAAGGVLAALAGVAGYSLTRGRGRVRPVA
ncbi:hypothetical protein [Actinacidiphila glaucinigra]|uniref:Secreted protein n=1 Tax=Actinacidiphila glaucinigra TaxID=235986 RepID=A0A239D4Y9_9ACTN|nr:hypothetical protein [Actinacidiphila glaucinigra]SNS26921.1 hypothetical protein SAMN05216252_104369 [Actinacidiphila glaucinigra]